MPEGAVVPVEIARVWLVTSGGSSLSQRGLLQPHGGVTDFYLEYFCRKLYENETN